MVFNFFNFLKKTNIDFCLMNGYKNIVAKVDVDSDIDILFKKNDFKNIQEILMDFCHEEKLEVVQMMHHDIWAKNFFLYNSKNGEFLNLDLYAEISRKQIVYFEEDEIFNSLEQYENIPILSPEKEFINYLIKKLDKDDFEAEHFNHLSELYQANKILCEKELFKFFPKKNILIIQSFNSNNFQKIIGNRDILIDDFYTLKSMNINRSIINTFRSIKRIIKPTGLAISFLGPDGSGKSTVIDILMTNRLPYRRKDYFHLKPIKMNNDVITLVDDPHAEPVYSSFKSYIKLLYFIYQYNMGWIKNILKLKIKSSLIIFDRYYDDLLIDNKRYRYGGSLLLAKFARLFIPQPDIYFILTTDPKIIYNRKQEVLFEELDRQVKAYRSIADGKVYFNIDVNRTPQEITREIILIMMEKMNERY